MCTAAWSSSPPRVEEEVDADGERVGERERWRERKGMWGELPALPLPNVDAFTAFDKPLKRSITSINTATERITNKDVPLRSIEVMFTIYNRPFTNWHRHTMTRHLPTTFLQSSFMLVSISQCCIVRGDSTRILCC